MLIAAGIALGLGVLMQPARAVPVVAAPTAQPSSSIVQVDRRCGRHYHYVRSHYNRAGLLVRGHCSPNRRPLL
jgi:hypothetical protein